MPARNWYSKNGSCAACSRCGIACFKNIFRPWMRMKVFCQAAVSVCSNRWIPLASSPLQFPSMHLHSSSPHWVPARWPELLLTIGLAAWVPLLLCSTHSPCSRCRIPETTSEHPHTQRVWLGKGSHLHITIFCYQCTNWSLDAQSYLTRLKGNTKL